MTLLERPIADRTVADWRLILANRIDRLGRLLDQADAPAAIPRFLVSNEIDLIRAALDALDEHLGDRPTADEIGAANG